MHHEPRACAFLKEHDLLSSPLSPFFAGLLLRAILPWLLHGFHHMDEHWQVMEPAGHLIWGDWSVATEWAHGYRSWIYPGLISLCMRFALGLGFKDPIWIFSFVRAAHGLLSSLAIPLAFVIVSRLHRGASAAKPFALAAAWMIALWPFAIHCGFHTHNEMVGALFVLLGAFAPLLIKSEKRAYTAAGIFFGMSLALKIDVGVAGFGYGIWQLLHGRLRRALWLLSGALPFLFLIGFVDRLTWGSWFHSVIGHARTNLIEGVGNQWGVSPWYVHFFYFFDMCGIFALIGSIVALFHWRKLPEPLKAAWFMNIFYVLVFAAIPHKEKRFLAPLIYTGIISGFASLATIPLAFRTILAACFILSIHATANVFHYFLEQPWWDRIAAMRDAGRIPGIEKMISPQWPAVFYLPKTVPSTLSEPDEASLKKVLMGARKVGIAVDWDNLARVEKQGFKCHLWPEAPKAPRPADTPGAWYCQRE